MGEVWYIENTWTCTTCQHRNKGRYMDCQNCGARREAGVQDEMPADVDAAPRVTDAEQLKQAKAGAHWECDFCGGQTRDLHGNCQNCGGDREDPTEREYNEPYKFDSFTPPPMESYLVEDLERVRSQVKSITGKGEWYPQPTWWERNRRRVIIGGAVAAGLGALTWFLLWLLLPHHVNATVADIKWNYLVELRQRVTKSGEGWRSSMPSSSFDESCHRRQRGTEDCNPYQCNQRQESYQCRPHQCNCQTTCTSGKNGYSRCSKSCSTCYDTCQRTVHDTCYHQCPVYADWCSYKYYEWPVIEQKASSGDDHKVWWPKMEKTGPHQRIDKHQRYKVHFTKGKERWEYKPKGLGDFKRFTPKEPWEIEVNRAGMVWPQRKLPLEA
jgi:hypothetical protein